MAEIIDLPDWLSPVATQLASLVDSERVPHALLLHGQPGIGRGLLAAWLARRLLNAPGRPADPLLHPDLLAVSPEPDRAQISVAQVRSLVDFVGLTATGPRKVGLVIPAETLTTAAANALLKTLEEPAGAAVLMLVVDNPRRLPATIVSRCQRLRVPTPSPEAATRFLESVDPSVNWRAWLALCGGAPLKALELRQLEGSDAVEFVAGLPDELLAVVRREEGPVPVARRWAKGPLPLALGWLQACVTALIARHFGDRDPSFPVPAALQNLPGGTNIAAWFDHLDRIQLARRQLDRGLNAELQLVDLLLFWVGLGKVARHA